MKKHLIACAALVTFLGFTFAADAVKSGPQVGDNVPGPFHPLNINGSKAGEKNCLFCSNGNNPVAMVFARDVSEPTVTMLIKKIDACTARNADAKMGSFVVFCNDDKSLEESLKKVAKEADLKQTVLAIDNPAGPEKYNVSKDADVTVVLYTDRVVKANYAFKKGELNDKAIEKVIADVTKILPEKK
jgi:hypothetical protein